MQNSDAVMLKSPARGAAKRVTVYKFQYRQLQEGTMEWCRRYFNDQLQLRQSHQVRLKEKKWAGEPSPNDADSPVQNSREHNPV